MTIPEVGFVGVNSRCSDGRGLLVGLVRVRAEPVYYHLRMTRYIVLFVMKT